MRSRLVKLRLTAILVILLNQKLRVKAKGVLIEVKNQLALINTHTTKRILEKVAISPPRNLKMFYLRVMSTTKDD